jgi:aldehyde:ferredoxin oxidoreductase
VGVRDTRRSPPRGGSFGRYLRVDLGRRASEIVPLAEAELRAVIGGVGLGALLLHRHPGALVFAFGPLLGTPLTTSAKLSIVARSPATSRFCDALSSSDFALEGKRTGFDALVIEGAAAEPSVLLLANERFDLVPVRDAGDARAPTGATAQTSSSAGDARASTGAAAQAAAAIAQATWTVPQTTAWLEATFPGHAFATAGPAAHHGVLFACIVNGGRHAGRGGLGALLVQKRLLAIGVRGTTPVPIAHEARTIALAKDLAQRSLGPATEKYRELGTVANLATFNRLAVLPTRNFQASTFEGAAALSGEALKTTRERGRGSCRNCTIGCEHFFEVRPGEPPQKVEYENVFALGPLCGVSDPETVLCASRLCDDLGLDTISTGATIAFAMECAERGLLDAYRDEAADLRFGNGEKLLSMIDAIAHRRTPLADLLAQGTRLAAARLGPEAEAIAPHIKGLEIPGYDPRALQTMALGLSVAARGADHNKSGAYDADLSGKVNRLAATPEAARHAVDSEDRAALMDSLILCKFLRGALRDLHAESAEMLRAVTGVDITPDELRATAARIVSLKKLWNERAGWTRTEDTLPPRFFDDPLPTGVARGTKLSRPTFAEMQRTYYESRGWTADGRIADPERAELSRLIGAEG